MEALEPQKGPLLSARHPFQSVAKRNEQIFASLRLHLAAGHPSSVELHLAPKKDTAA